MVVPGYPVMLPHPQSVHGHLGEEDMMVVTVLCVRTRPMCSLTLTSPALKHLAPESPPQSIVLSSAGSRSPGGAVWQQDQEQD